MSLPEYLPNRMRSPTCDVERDDLAIFQALAFSDSHHFALLGLLFGRIGNVQAAVHLLRLFNSLDHNAVIERTNFHGNNLQFQCVEY